MARGDIATIPNGTTLGQPIYFNQALLQTPLLTLSSFGDWDRAKGLSKASYYRYQNTLRNVLREVNDDLATHEYFSNRLTQAMNAKRHFNDAYQLNQRLYRQGIISYTQLLREKIKLDNIKLSVNQYKLDQLISVVRLYQDLAAGYGCASCH
jgi:outer membrane protein TolC